MSFSVVVITAPSPLTLVSALGRKHSENDRWLWVGLTLGNTDVENGCPETDPSTGPQPRELTGTSLT